MTKSQESFDSREEQIRNSASVATPAGQHTHDQKLARIRELNDRLRTTGRGGMTVITNGVAALGSERVNQIFQEVANFTDFNADNNPWGERDCAVLTVNGTRIMFKIDYYDRTRRFHSPDPADPKVTVRVLTIMTADEY